LPWTPAPLAGSALQLSENLRSYRRFSWRPAETTPDYGPHDEFTDGGLSVLPTAGGELTVQEGML
jgi:hypothetical protein